MRQDRPRKPLARADRDPRAAQVPPPAQTSLLARDAKQASPAKKCSICGAILESNVEHCSNCTTGGRERTDPNGDLATAPFKPYANIGSPTEKQLYETLVHAFSEMDPRARPWCGIGLEMGLLVVSPTDVTVADIREVQGIQHGIVHVPRNWRKPWHVETANGAHHELQSSPSEQAERAVSSIKQSLESLRDDDTKPGLPRIKYLIVFPNGYDFEGPKEFSIIDRDGVLTLTLQNLRNVPQAILQTTRDEKLDSRKYRKWIEDSVPTKKDDSIIGTWLDPAFDKIEVEPNAPFWRLGQSRDPETLAEEEKLSAPASSRTRSIQTTSKWSPSKVFLSVITGIVIGTVGWRLYHDGKAATSVSRPRPRLLPPSSDKTTNPAQAIQAAMPRNNPLSAEKQERTPASAARISAQSEAPELESTAKNQIVESAKKSRDSSQDSQDAELKRQKIELQIRHAIGLRAVTGVTVNFTGDKAYLNGQVHTENQRTAAEKAARSIRGVKEVYNSIVVITDG